MPYLRLTLFTVTTSTSSCRALSLAGLSTPLVTSRPTTSPTFSSIRTTSMIAHTLRSLLRFETNMCCSPYREANAKSELKITYTAMHGVGTPWVAKAFEVGLP